MVLFCSLWTFVFYLFWLSIRPESGDSGPVWAILIGSAAAVGRFFVPTFVEARGFGLSRFVSAFIDYTSFPALFPLVAALLISHFYPRSGITDFTGFVLLAMAPVSLVYCSSCGLGHEALRLVLTPLLWTALAAAFYPFVRLFKGGVFHKIAAVSGMTVFSLLPPLAWFDFFRQNYIEGAAILTASFAPMAVLCILFCGKNACGEGA
ncbi:MAG: hypothetical protein LBB47_00465 [Spirochaetaceae bacterium]|jgi:hypothetical protein|nr:hypothetical protein [Spirochaetaceae bacterium]